MWKIVTESFKKNPFAASWLLLMLSFAVFANFIATEEPLMVKKSTRQQEGSNNLLVQDNYRNVYLQNEESYDRIIFAPVAYGPGVIDADNVGLHSPLEGNYFTKENGAQQEMPFRFRHMLGTDARGCDVLSGVIHGARYSLSIAFFAMLITAFIALITGIFSGYFAAEGMIVNRFYFLIMCAGSFFSWFYGYYVQRFELASSLNDGIANLISRVLFSLVIITALLFLFHKVASFFIKRFQKRKNITVPVDGLVTRITELFTAVPKVILIISLVAISKPSVLTLIFVFGIMEWTDLSRMIRAEVMRLRQSGFVEAAIATGLSTRQIIVRHILPNVFPVLVPVFLYGISVVILTESGLAFLGLGVSPGTVTWGNLIAQGKENIQAWWLMLFPGLMILFTVLSLNAVRKR